MKKPNQIEISLSKLIKQAREQEAIASFGSLNKTEKALNDTLSSLEIANKYTENNINILINAQSNLIPKSAHSIISAQELKANTHYESAVNNLQADYQKKIARITPPIAAPNLITTASYKSAINDLHNDIQNKLAGITLPIEAPNLIATASYKSAINDLHNDIQNKLANVTSSFNDVIKPLFENNSIDKILKGSKLLDEIDYAARYMTILSTGQPTASTAITIHGATNFLTTENLYKNLLEPLNHFQSDSSDALIVRDGIILYGNNAISNDNLLALIREIVDQSLDAPLQHIEQLFEELISNIKSQNSPFKSILFPLILFLLSPFLNDTYTSIKENIKLNKIELKAYLYSRKIIISKKVNVRQSNSINSVRIGELYLGYEVDILEKKKEWFRVRWHNNDKNLLLEGWVYSKHLKNIE